MEKIRIFHIIKSLGRGGAEMLLPETLKFHDKDIFEFHYGYFLPWKNQMVESIVEQDGKVTCFSASSNLLMMTKVGALVKYVKRNNIQLIHAHLPWAGVVSRIVGKVCNIPVIYTEHNKQERYHVGTRWLNLVTMNYNNTVVAVSEDVASSIRKHKPGNKAPIQTILNGVNTDYFQKEDTFDLAVRKELEIPIHAPIIGTIAVFRFQKRLDLWMDLALKIMKRHPDVHFIIVGDGPLRANLMEKRNAMGLQNRIHMPGLKVEVRPYLSSFDLYMMTSIFEGLPIALLEAMAMECPIISTDAGGVKEVIRHETDGLLCDVQKPDKLIEFADRLLNDSTTRSNLGKQARKRVLDTFNMATMVYELEQLYLKKVTYQTVVK